MAAVEVGRGTGPFPEVLAVTVDFEDGTRGLIRADRHGRLRITRVQDEATKEWYARVEISLIRDLPDPIALEWLEEVRRDLLTGEDVLVTEATVDALTKDYIPARPPEEH